jgi:hypothetical protein
MCHCIIAGCGVDYRWSMCERVVYQMLRVQGQGLHGTG